MKREIIRVEPISTYLNRYSAPASPVTRAGDMVFVSGLPPFDPKTGEIFTGSIIDQTRLVLEQMKACLEAAGSDLDHVLKCQVYSTNTEYFPIINEVYRSFFPSNQPARVFINVAGQPGLFDVEIDCVAVRKD